MRLFGRILAMLLLASPVAYAQTRYNALQENAATVKDLASTPLIAITRAGKRLAAVGTHGVIVLSDDNGITWRQAAVPVDLTLTSIFFSSATDVWAAGHYGVILHSADAGLTWTKVLDGRDVIHDLTEVSNQAQSTQASSPDARLKLRVANAFQQAGPAKPFLAAGPCGNGMLVAGQQDMAMFSQDHGKSWQSWTAQIDNPNFQNIYGVLNAGGDTLLVGEGGLVLKSAGGCNGFKALPGPYTATLFGGIVIPPRTVFLYGLDGGLFRSGDGGATWATIPMPPDSVIDAGILLQSGKVLLGTLSGTMYLSNAQGNNFRQLSVSEPFQIADIALAPNGNIITVGNVGVGIVAAKLIQ